MRFRTYRGTQQKTNTEGKHTSEEAMAQFDHVHRRVTKKMRAAKEGWIEEQCDAIEKGTEAGNRKQAFDTLNSRPYT